MNKNSFIICFHTARFDNLLQTLRFLNSNHNNVIKESELVTVCQNSVELYKDYKNKTLNEFEKLSSCFNKNKHFDLEIEEMKLAYMTNFGVSNTETDRLVLLESDRILPADYFDKVLNQLGPKKCITCKNMKKLTKPVTDEEIVNNQFEYKDEDRSEENLIGQRNMWSGNTAFWKKDFFDAEQMDEGYVGYGWADSDTTQKMNEIRVQNIFMDDIELHLWHEPLTYGKLDQKELFIQNGIRYCKKWNKDYPDWFKKEILEFNRKKLF